MARKFPSKGDQPCLTGSEVIDHTAGRFPSKVVKHLRQCRVWHIAAVQEPHADDDAQLSSTPWLYASTTVSDAEKIRLTLALDLWYLSM